MDKKVYVVKNNDVLLSGDRDDTDKLFNIPLRTKDDYDLHQIEYNIKKPKIHPSVYKTTSSLSTPSSNSTKPSFFKAKIKIKKSFTNIFRHMDHLIDDFCDNHILRKQKKEDQIFSHQAFVILQHDKMKKELAQYLHAALFSPVRSTLLLAVQNNHFITWPGLDKQLVSKHLC